MVTKFMKASILAVNLLKDLEGWRDKPYKDSGGLCTLGYGHLIEAGEFCPDQITLEQGEKYLRDDIAKAEHIVNSTVSVPLKQNQFDALVSFTFNVGAGAWAISDTLKILNNGEYHRIPARMMMWVKVTKNGVKVVEEGLINRRLKEVRVWQGE
mgnify:CR=1 FL=1